MTESTRALLEIESLSVTFSSSDRPIHAVRDLSLHIEEGETVGIVGESGSGKSVTALAIVGLLTNADVRGQIVLNGQHLTQTSETQMRRIRGREIGMIFQDPMTSLNPTTRVGRQVTEALAVHDLLRQSERAQRAIELLRTVDIPAAEKRAGQFPFELSGGMRQRAMIASAIAARPSLLIADEPTTALDVTTQAQIIDVLKQLKETGTSILLITHDMGVAAGIADRIYVMYAGLVMEVGTAEDLLAQPRHPYTKGLLKAIPRVDTRVEDIAGIPGRLPDPSELVSECIFRPRCVERFSPCSSQPPLMDTGSATIACWLAKNPLSE